MRGVKGSDDIARFGLCSDCVEARERQDREREQAERRRRIDAEADQRRARIEELLVECGLDRDADHLRATMQNFQPRPDREALQEARNFVARFRSGERPNLFLFSRRPRERIAPGSGKTHLAAAVLRELLLSGDVTPQSAAFVRETRMTITLRRMIGGGGRPEDYLDGLIRKDLLIIDDVGKAKTDTAWLQELMFELIAGREPRATIITSNFDPEQLERRDDYYIALNSRLIGKGPVLCLSGPDRRLLRAS
ncbi:ATP-binding protein [Thioalkalivibrio sp.]|uniref:ATP-binding protein n=1 Tax=Thioalkalivibrio sp. TaxID=2093813 RepID=UPI0035636EAD